MAKPIELRLKVGDKAPEFSAPSSGGKTVSLADYGGRNVVLYFYPKDDTPGCTKEACAFRDEYGAIGKKGAIVLGVSTDSVASHDKFTTKYRLPFTLLADEGKTIVRAYGVVGAKDLHGAEIRGSVSRDIPDWPRRADQEDLAHRQARSARCGSPRRLVSLLRR